MASHFRSDEANDFPRRDETGARRPSRARTGAPASEYFEHINDYDSEDDLPGEIPPGPEPIQGQGVGYARPGSNYARSNEGGGDHRAGYQRPRHHSPARAVVVALLLLACVALACWLFLFRGCSADSSAANGNSAAQSQAANLNQSALPSNQSADDEKAQATTATDILSTLPSLVHAGEDCSLPTDGAEVDVLDGRVLVAFESSDTSESTISRMAMAAAALTDALSSSSLSDSSTADGGVSQVPAASTPAAITETGQSTAFSSVEVVALGPGPYVISTVTLSSTEGLSGAGASAILSAADSYAINTSAYRYSGLGGDVAQSRGDAPTLLTGEAIVINLSSEPATTSSSSTNANANSASTGTSSSSTSSTTTSGSTSGYSSYGSGTTSYGGSSSSGYGYYGYDYDYTDDSSDDGSYDTTSDTSTSSTDTSSATSQDTGTSEASTSTSGEGSSSSDAEGGV